METWALQAASLIALGCFFVVYSVISILYYYKEYVRSKDHNSYEMRDYSIPFNYLFSGIINLPWRIKNLVKSFFEKPKEEKTIKSPLLRLPFDVPFNYSLVYKKSYNSLDEENLEIEIIPKDSKYKYYGTFQIGPRKDGTWGYLNFSLEMFIQKHQNKDDRISWHKILKVGDSLLEIDKELKSIINTFQKHIPNSTLGYALRDKWEKWIKDIDNFEAMKGHNAINKK